MTIALLSPDPRLRELTDLGVVAPGALLYTYAAGSTTPLATYSDFELTTPNQNPMEASTGGLFGPIYLNPGTQYKYELTTALGVPLWEQDHVGTGGVVQASLYNVLTYGATGGGVVDDAAAIQAAIDACVAGGGGVVFFPKGTYRCIATLTLTAGGVTFQGEGRSRSVIQWTDAASKGLTIIGPSTNNHTLLTQNVAVGNRALTVTDTTGMVVGQFCYVEDDAANTGSWISRIQSIVGLTVTLEDSAPCALTMASNVTLYAYTTDFLSGIVVNGLGLTCVAGNGTTNKLTLLEVRRCQNALIENCEFNGAAAPTVTVAQCFNSWFQQNLFMNALTVAGTGLEMQNSTGCTIQSNTANMCQFGIVTASSPWTRIISNRIDGLATSVALGRGMRIGNSSNFTVVLGNNVSDTNLFGIYNQDSADVTIAENTVSWSGAGGTTQQHGIAVGGFEDAFCIRCNIVGNRVNGATGAGIFVATNNVSPDLYATIVGNNVSRCVQRAVYVGAQKCTIVGNILSGNGATNFQLLNIGQSGGYCIIEGNNFDKETTNVTAIFTASGNGNNVIGPNVFNGLSNTLLASDTTYLTTVQTRQPLPEFKATQVATDGDLLEKTAWSFTIPGGTLTVDGQGFFLRADLHSGANVNTKTIRAYVGAEVLTGASGSNNEDIQVYFDVARRGVGAVFFMGYMYRNGVSIVQSALYGAVDWTADVEVKITMQNSVPTANDIVFNGGKCTFEGIPTTAFI